MAKRRSFEDLLQADFRWPRRGDAPFLSSEEGMDNATLASPKRMRLVLMLSGYKKAADLLVEHAMNERADRDVLVYTIVFNYRQFVELSLKYLISAYGPAVGIPANWQTHNLVSLWVSFESMLTAYGTSDPDDADPIVKDVVSEFAKIDPGSYSYRYPVDQKGHAIPLTHSDLHLPTLRDVMEAVDNYFTGTDGYLDALTRS